MVHVDRTRTLRTIANNRIQIVDDVVFAGVGAQKIGQDPKA